MIPKNIIKIFKTNPPPTINYEITDIKNNTKYPPKLYNPKTAVRSNKGSV